jgi:hypothetical protein
MKKTPPGMTTRRYALAALATLGLALAAPVHARHDFSDGPFVVAKRDRDEEVRRDRREERRDVRRDREAESDEPQGYGYGYERRQQERNEEDERRRGRR